jgi:hypothetical protein
MKKKTLSDIIKMEFQTIKSKIRRLLHHFILFCKKRSNNFFARPDFEGFCDTWRDHGHEAKRLKD